MNAGSDESCDVMMRLATRSTCSHLFLGVEAGPAANDDTAEDLMQMGARALDLGRSDSRHVGYIAGARLLQSTRHCVCIPAGQELAVNRVPARHFVRTASWLIGARGSSIERRRC